MKKHLLLVALAGLLGLPLACAVASPDPKEDTKTGSTSEPLMGAEQICCSNISGWGSVVYYQSWAGYGWVTGDTFYHSGTSCPGTSGSCQRVEPIK